MTPSAAACLAIAACLSFALHGCGGDDAPTTQGPKKENDIVELAMTVPTLKKLVEAVGKAELATVLKGKGPFTVFAPTDAAFTARFPEGSPALTKDVAARLLKYHVIKGKVKSTDLEATQTVDTLETPKQLTITKEGEVVTVGDGAKVTGADNDASNGVVHIIDKVLTVPNDIVELAVASPTLSKLVKAVGKAELATVLKGTGPYTVFAPNDEAFKKAYTDEVFDALTKEQVARLLRYHVIEGTVKSTDLVATQTVDTLETPKQLTITKEGEVVTVGDISKVTVADNIAYNGVVHIIDTVLTVPEFLALV